MSAIAVNVSIVTYNSEDYVEDCLKAVLAQTFPHISITIVDNASADNSLALVEKVTAGEITIIKNENNIGFAAAHNQAMRLADSAYVLCLNPDIWLAPDYISELVAALEKDDTLGSAAGTLLRVNSWPPDLTQHYPIDSTGLYMTPHRQQRLAHELEDPTVLDGAEPTPIFGPDGAAPLYRRAMLEDAKVEGEYYDELFVTHKEDVDLAWRAQLLGWKSIHVPSAVGYHVRGFRPGKRRNIQPDIRRMAVRNRWLLMIKNELPGLFLRYIPQIIAYDLAILVYILLLEQHSLLAIRDVIRLAPAMLRHRKIIHSRRKVSTKYMARWFRRS